MRFNIFFLILLIIGLYPTKGYSQCVPDPVYSEPGVYPDSVTGFADACIDFQYEQLITVVVPIDTTVMIGMFPVTLNYDSVVIVSFTGLPPGFTYLCYDGQNIESPVDQCAFEGNTKGCVLISGMPTSSDFGLYPLTITVDAYLSGSTVPNATQVITYYSIDVNNCIVEIQEEYQSKFQVSPNPASDFIKITNEGNQVISKVELYRINGSLVKSILMTDHSIEMLEINGLQEGIYFLRVYSDKSAENVKIIIKN